MRLYEMFIGDFEKSAPWSTESDQGLHAGSWSACGPCGDCLWTATAIRPELEAALHKTIKKVTEDIEALEVQHRHRRHDEPAQRDLRRTAPSPATEFKTLLILLNPFAPHITEELWEQCGFEGQLCPDAQWPEFDEAKCVEDTVEIAVQVNGKLRAKLTVATGAAKEDAIAAAKAEPNVAKALEGKTICKEIYAPGKRANIAVR